MRYDGTIKGAALFASLLLSVPTLAGWLNPHLELYPGCTNAQTLPHSELLDLTLHGQLFVVVADPESESMDAVLALRHGFQGAIFDVDILNDNLPLTAQSVHFTETLVRRDASIPERFLGGPAEDSFFFVINLPAGTYLLSADSFDYSRFRICEELLSDIE